MGKRNYTGLLALHELICTTTLFFCLWTVVFVSNSTLPRIFLLKDSDSQIMQSLALKFSRALLKVLASLSSAWPAQTFQGYFADRYLPIDSAWPTFSPDLVNFIRKCASLVVRVLYFLEHL